MDHVLEQLGRDLAKKVARDHDELIQHALPEGAQLPNVLNQISVMRAPDGTKTVSFQGKPIIQFAPAQHETREGNDCVKYVTTQPYRTFD